MGAMRGIARRWQMLIGALVKPHRGAPEQRLMAAVTRRLREPSSAEGPTSISAELVDDHSDLVHLSVPIADLPQVAGLERWLAQHLVGRFPGSGRADQ